MQVNGILVPVSEVCEYRHFTLPNGCSVLLCHNPSADNSAASMNVSVGTSCPHLARPTVEGPLPAHWIKYDGLLR
ncbi:hypothetical protein EON67_11725 [archaeon]|nr:MAG: hypothetical protein EON67_11725 [archaeon]